MLPKKVGWLDHLAAEMEEPYTFVNNTVINGPSIKVFIGTSNGNDAKKKNRILQIYREIGRAFTGKNA